MGLIEDEQKELQIEFEAAAKDSRQRLRKYKRINRFLLIVVILAAAAVGSDFYFRTKIRNLFPDSPEEKATLIQHWKDENFVLSLNKNNAVCIVDEAQWQLFDKDSKRDILLLLAEYCRPDTLSTVKVMTIKSSSGEKVLAHIDDEDIVIH